MVLGSWMPAYSEHHTQNLVNEHDELYSTVNTTSIVLQSSPEAVGER